MKEPVRIGVVGAGAIAQTAHLPVLAKMREKANDIVANHQSLATARNYMWAGIEKGWVVVEDLTAAGL